MFFIYVFRFNIYLLKYFQDKTKLYYTLFFIYDKKKSKTMTISFLFYIMIQKKLLNIFFSQIQNHILIFIGQQII